MDVAFFISRKLRFKGGLTIISVAVSFLVMIIAVSVSSGFRKEIRDGLSAVSGDIRITPPDLNVLDNTHPIERTPSYLSDIEAVDGVADIVPVVYRAGIIKQNDNIHGVLFKGIPRNHSKSPVVSDTLQLAVSIPRRLSEISGLAEGDVMTTYFIGEKVRVRKFRIQSIYDALIETDDQLLVYADMADLQRVDNWEENQVSALEVILDDSHKDEERVMEVTQEIGAYISTYSANSEAPVVATSSISSYPQLFDWLHLIDFNVLFILVLMTIVAGFNMISGLLIMLFENISVIGLLKALGMNDRAISKTFLSSAAVLVLKGMLIGNILALLLCFIQDKTHILKLDPENYFVAYVPMNLNFTGILLADIISFIVIMLLMLIPTLFISRVDPAQTIRVK